MRQIGKAEGLERLAASMAGTAFACPICAIAHNQVPEIEVIHATPRHQVVLDNFASRPGHLLVLPVAHIEDITELSRADFIELHDLAWQAARALTRVYSPRRIWVASLGSHTTLPMSCPHAHLHVLPITEEGEASRPAQVLSWSTSLYAFEPGEAAATADGIRAAWQAKGPTGQ
jgi:diadenosine tetraphosphate (Ap4A) HIT family hydrolase